MTDNNWTASELNILYKPGYKCENPLTNPLSAYMFIRSVWNPELFHLQAQFMAFFIDPQGRTIAYRHINTGTMYSTTVDIRLIASLAVHTLSSFVMTAQSRPSGKIKAYEQDLAIAKRLKDGLHLLDITLWDHLILSEKNYLSMSQENLI